LCRYFKLGHGDQIWFLWCGALQLRDRAAISDFLKAPMHNPMAKPQSSIIDDEDSLAASFARPLTAVCVKPAPKAATSGPLQIQSNVKKTLTFVHLQHCSGSRHLTAKMTISRSPGLIRASCACGNCAMRRQLTAPYARALARLLKLMP
jgi:hypothetical protein